MPQRTLSDYKKIVGQNALEEIYLLAENLKGKHLKMVNSTAVGGGVAEILNRLVPFLNEVGVSTKWDVIKGNDAFFQVTKSFHNAIHGAEVEISQKMFDIFDEITESNLRDLTFDEDFIVIHDPQPAGLIKVKKQTKAKWIWRCHIDSSRPFMPVWDFLKKYVEKYDASIFSAPSFARALPIPQYMISPSIDPLSEKNQPISKEYIHSVMEKYQLDTSRPLVTQISRFDYLKDPVGVIDAYKLAKARVDCQLVLAGGWASDDPESAQVLNEVKEHAGNDPDIHVLVLPPFSDLEINALQRASTIVLQKSLREGFGLTVTEGLWKGKPVIASAVGGIPLQIRHNVTGILVHSIEGTAYHIRNLIQNPEIAEALGKVGKEHVRNKFLITRNLKDYLILLNIVSQPGKKVLELP